MEIGIFYDNVKNAYSGIKDELILLEKVKELGCSYIELDCDVLAEKNPGFFRKAEELSIGFSVYAFADENCILRNGKKAEDYLPFLARHNISNLMMVCFPPDISNKSSDEISSAIISSLNTLCEEAGRYGITILAEDFDNHSVPCGNCDDMLFFASGISKLKFTFDTGNFAFFGEDALQCYDRLKKRIAHVHLKDRVSLNDLKVTTTGKGGLPVSEIINRLAADGYNGKMSVEMFGADSDPDELKAAVEYVSRLITDKDGSKL